MKITNKNGESIDHSTIQSIYNETIDSLDIKYMHRRHPNDEIFMKTLDPFKWEFDFHQTR